MITLKPLPRIQAIEPRPPRVAPVVPVIPPEDTLGEIIAEALKRIAEEAQVETLDPQETTHQGGPTETPEEVIQAPAPDPWEEDATSPPRWFSTRSGELYLRNPMAPDLYAVYPSLEAYNNREALPQYVTRATIPEADIRPVRINMNTLNISLIQ